jgi:putative transposase
VQVETAFIAALEADGKGWLLEDDTLAEQLASGQIPDNDDRVPVLLAVSDNGPQMTSSKTASFMAIARIAQHFGRPRAPRTS